MDKEKEKTNPAEEDEYSLDYFGKHILSYKQVLAVLLPLLLPEEFFGMDLKKIISDYLDPSISNPDRVDLKAQQVDTIEGKQTIMDLHFTITTPSGRKVIINVELQRDNSNLILIRASVYSAKLIAEQKHSDYKDYSPVISAWINLKPLAKLRNTIVTHDLKSNLLIIEKGSYRYEAKPDYPYEAGLQRTVEINVGGPQYDNFTEEIKFFYDLFHNNVDDLKEFYKKRNIEFNEEIYEPMIEYMTLDQQTKNVYTREGEQKGLKIGKQEGLIEGRQEGLIEGKQEGLQEGYQMGTEDHAKKVYENMLQRGYSEEEARELAYNV